MAKDTKTKCDSPKRIDTRKKTRIENREQRGNRDMRGVAWFVPRTSACAEASDGVTAADADSDDDR